MNGPSAPTPPDPEEVAGAQVAQNIGTAIAQGTLNNVNQVTPDGSLTYSQTGTTQWRDPNTGERFDIPQFTAVQTLSEDGQRVMDAQNAADINMANFAADQTDRMGDLLGTPFSIDTGDTEARLMELGMNRLSPAFERRREQTRAQLSAQGIKEGSAAFDRAMARLGESENDAMNELLLSGRGQAVQEALTVRNQPINEITALLSGSQVSQPRFVPTNPAQIANVDRAGLEMAEYDAELANWRQQQQNRQNLMGGLFGLASGGLTGGYF